MDTRFVAPTAYRPDGRLTSEQLDALLTYALANGRTWKSKLADDWMNGRTSGTLQVLRNTLGPTWLVNLRLAR